MTSAALPERQIGGGEGLDPVEVEIVQPPDLGLRELVVGEVGEGGSAPQVQSRSHHRGSLVRLAGLDPASPVLDQPFEPAGVDGIGLDVELVSGRPCGDQATTGEGLERLAELGDVDLDRMQGRPRRAIAPEHVDQPIRRDDLAGMHQEDREDGPLLRRAQLGTRSVGACFEAPEDPELHRLPRGSATVGRWWARHHPRSTRGKAGASRSRSALRHAGPHASGGGLRRSGIGLSSDWSVKPASAVDARGPSRSKDRLMVTENPARL